MCKKNLKKYKIIQIYKMDYLVEAYITHMMISFFYHLMNNSTNENNNCECMNNFNETIYQNE